MNYRSFADLSRDIKNNLHKIPKDVSLIVGIPRSGLLAANLISIYTNLPLTDIDSFIEGKILCPGFQDKDLETKALKGKILIVDDSVATGKAIVDARQKLKSIIDAATYDLLFCCIYADPEKKHLVDIPLLLLNRPRVFEWNFFHNKVMEKSGLYLNGVLAIVPEKQEKDSNFFSIAQPFIIPKKKIASIFYSQEVINPTTMMEWLHTNNVQYEELVMCDPSVAGLEYKKRKNLTLFIATNKQNAQQIFDESGKDVYCLEDNTMYSGQHFVSASLKNKTKRFLNKFKRKLKSFN